MANTRELEILQLRPVAIEGSNKMVLLFMNHVGDLLKLVFIRLSKKLCVYFYYYLTIVICKFTVPGTIE